MFHVDNGVIRTGRRPGFESFLTRTDALANLAIVGACYSPAHACFICRDGSRPSFTIPTPADVLTAIDAIFA